MSHKPLRRRRRARQSDWPSRSYRIVRSLYDGREIAEFWLLDRLADYCQRHRLAVVHTELRVDRIAQRLELEAVVRRAP